MELNEKMEIRVKRRAILWLASTVFSLFLAGLSGWVIKLHYDYQNIPSEHLIGNKVTNIKALKEKGFPFSFLAIGDTQSREKAEKLMKLALREKNYSFMIIVGDFVKEPDIWNHRFFLTEMTTEIKPPFPVFLTAGNHDIDYGLKIKEDERRVSPEVFESLYGARNFDFVFNECLFIICDIDPRNHSSYLNYLRNTLSKKAEGKKYIFIFIHYPPQGVYEVIDPPLSQEKIGTLFPNEADFSSLLETYRVTTCFFGHYHGYWRGQRKGTNLVVSGGGGARLKESKSPWGKFHHILKVGVDQQVITEEMITLEERFSIEDFFEEWIFINLFPIIENRAWALYLLLILILTWDVYAVILFVTSLKKC